MVAQVPGATIKEEAVDMAVDSAKGRVELIFRQRTRALSIFLSKYGANTTVSLNPLKMPRLTFRVQAMTPIVGLLHRRAVEEEEEECTTGEGKTMVPPRLREQIPLPEGEETVAPLMGGESTLALGHHPSQ